jgi:HPt (histidine-containing phosphotransfer) domain-containing protein
MARISFGAHKIAGLAPSLGFQSLGQRANRIELAAESYRKSETTGDLGPLLNEVDTLLDEMEQLLD